MFSDRILQKRSSFNSNANRSFNVDFIVYAYNESFWYKVILDYLHIILYFICVSFNFMCALSNLRKNNTILYDI